MNKRLRRKQQQSTLAPVFRVSEVRWFPFTDREVESIFLEAKDETEAYWTILPYYGESKVGLFVEKVADSRLEWANQTLRLANVYMAAHLAGVGTDWGLARFHYYCQLTIWRLRMP